LTESKLIKQISQTDGGNGTDSVGQQCAGKRRPDLGYFNCTEINRQHIKSAFQICLNLTGMLCLWLGLLKIAERAGVTDLLAKALAPLFRRILPGVPSDSPALGSIVMNMAANVLGLDNAATPMGLKAMEQLQSLNPHKDRASPAQVLFMVINASAVTLIPITILMYRAELGSANPSAVFMPILFATSLSTLADGNAD
jgi:spore maturation protein SpmA